MAKETFKYTKKDTKATKNTREHEHSTYTHTHKLVKGEDLYSVQSNSIEQERFKKNMKKKCWLKFFCVYALLLQ